MIDPRQLNRIEVIEYLDDNGEIFYSVTPSEGMTFPDTVKLLEMAKLTLNDVYRNGEWEDE